MSNPDNIRKGGYQPRQAAPPRPPAAPAGWRPSQGAQNPFTGQPLRPSQGQQHPQR